MHAKKKLRRIGEVNRDSRLELIVIQSDRSRAGKRQN